MGAESGVGVGKGEEGVHGDGVVCFVYPFVKNQKAGMFALDKKAYWELALPCRPKAGNNLVDHQSIISSPDSSQLDLKSLAVEHVSI